MDYIAIVVTIIMLIGIAGCIKHFGEMVFWFWAGVAVCSGAVLCQMAER